MSYETNLDNYNMTAGVEYSYFVAYNLRISGTFA